MLELFAGVGGFRLALEGSPLDSDRRHLWQTVWANQWEPSTKSQHAFECYVQRFGSHGAINDDIHVVLQEIERGEREPIPDHELLVGGFPCQDYSVAKTLGQAHGLQGKKGVLWWSIHKILEQKRPALVLLENVDRLLKSPASQRGRDFAIILACLSDLGYRVEWRVINAADYGIPQRRRRVFIVARLVAATRLATSRALSLLHADGVLARALPVTAEQDGGAHYADTSFDLVGHPARITQEFGWGNRRTPFKNAGVMQSRRVWTRAVAPLFNGTRLVLRDVVVPDEDVPDEFLIPKRQISQWEYLKGAKRVQRTSANGFRYEFAEGAIAFPDSLDLPSRTIVTGEGGPTPSRFKHVVRMSDGRLRRLTPVELERLNGFPDNWTDTQMSDGRRAFMMGNALAVDVVRRIGRELSRVVVFPSLLRSEATPDLSRRVAIHA